MLWPSKELDAAYSNILENSLNRGCTVLIVVAAEADALCSASILLKLFESDNILCRINPVENPGDLDEIFEELHTDWEESVELKKASPGIASVIFVNCAGDIDIKTRIGNGFNSRFYYVSDFRRPYNTNNVSIENEQIVVFQDSSDDFVREEAKTQEKPIRGKRKLSSTSLDDSTNETESSKDSQSVSDSSLVATETTFDFEYYGQPSSHTYFMMTQQMNRAEENIVWLSVIGAYYQYTRAHLSRESYNLLLQEYSTFAVAMSSTTVKLDLDYNLFLYRFIPLYTSLLYSKATSYAYGVSKELALKVFDSFSNSWVYKTEGTYRLNILLAKLGFSKEKCTEIATTETRNKLFEALEQNSKLEKLQLPCFTRILGFGEKLSSKDYCTIVSAMLNSNGYKQEAIDMLLKDETTADLEDGIKLAQNHRRVIACVAERIISNKEAKSAGDFRYIMLKNLVTIETDILQNPYCLYELALFIMEYHVENGKWQGLSFKPLVICLAFHDEEFDKAALLFLALESNPKQTDGKFFFRHAFERAAEAAKLDFQLLCFNQPSLVAYETDMETFLTSLHEVVLDIN